jgi:isoquinoline 1-oxidoreductase beta subunit
MNSESIEKNLMEGLNKPGAVATNVGDVKKALGEASKKLEATYYVPIVAHTTMEPMNCTAYVQNDRCDVWIPTQNQTLTQIVASKLSGLPPGKVHVHTTLMRAGETGT